MARIKNYQTEKQWQYVANSSLDLDDTKYSKIFLNLLANRGYDTAEKIESFINPKYQKLSSPLDIPNMKNAVECIVEAIENNNKIVIYGDYDVDGITATALLYKFFEQIGIAVETYIPSRHTEGYGLNSDAIRQIADNGCELIITVDCGTSSKNEVDLAHELGMKIIVTDHHVIKDKLLLPKNCPIINPQLIKAESPLKALAGVGVAFYLVRAIIDSQPELLPEGQEKWLLDLVALGTVCDIVSLTNDNRILVYYGLKVLSKSKNYGINALAELIGINLKQITSYDIGFGFGPRLNAAGRLEHAKNALDLLITNDETKAKRIAEELNFLNKDRQELTERVVIEAKRIIETEKVDNSILLLSDSGWPAGVVGIVASRLVEDYNRPVLVMEDMGEELKGSARSVAGFNIVEALGECSDCFVHYGGHEYAAGFTLPKSKFVILNDKLISIADKHFSIKKITPTINIDLDLNIPEVSREFLNEIDKMAPFGKDNSKPVFSISNARLIEAKLVGNPPVHLKMSIAGNGGSLKGIAFGWGETLDLNLDKCYDLALNLELNSFNGYENVEFRLVDIRESN